MAMEKIILDIEPDGTTTVEASGFKGKVCTKATEWLEKLLGKVQKRTYKEDYWKEEHVKVRS